jgi:SAM-dependent methyltransferase
MSNQNQPYDNNFYNAQMNGSYVSAKFYAALLSNLFIPSSVVDVGCGRGTWLKAFKEIGAMRLVGLDGEWNTQDNLVDSTIEFNATDLNHLRANGQKFDLAMSLEVAEHLEPGSATTFINFLTDLSDVILFGAAFIGQGGENHINEQTHSYWAKLFLSRGYVPFDIFRPIIWGNPKVEFWYQQNTFLYVRQDSKMCTEFIAKGANRIPNLDFMDCVHPTLYLRRLAERT